VSGVDNRRAAVRPTRASNEDKGEWKEGFKVMTDKKHSACRCLSGCRLLTSRGGHPA
jgi:hypothetical protein